MMKQEFDAWWDDDNLTYKNPFKKETPAYWAWEGWVAGVKAAQALEQPADKPTACSHNWFRTGAMENGEARCIKCGEWKKTEKPADARLIAAAPDLLEALKSCWDLGIDKSLVPLVSAAIAKATGVNT